MTAVVTSIHRCRYVLWTADRGWVSVSGCCHGRTVQMDPPSAKKRAA